ncbi:MAG: Hsp20/alpha crystallin family protein [Chromatiales bacterium]|nr:Hsp20/alpha crystallin family protein [Chromatiales bacterium]
MSKLVNWDPMREIDQFFGRYSPFLHGRRAPDREGQGGMEWSPAADLSETGEAYIIKADLPGVKKEDIQVTLGDGMLMLSGERHEEKEEKEETRLRVERFFGSFSRSFGVPDDADLDGISAEQKDGSVTIRIPRRKTAAARRVQIPVK